MNKGPWDRVFLVVLIIGGLNWLLVGLFQYDLIAAIFGGVSSVMSRTIYSIVGISALYCISLLFREAEPAKER